ncbi:Legumin A [Morus notabilis]|uniref:11S seed storage protein n=1 Tax=Morus notabilis TaxID=981085 RepID=W9SHD0_9ROSA|nr:legumin A [Morus notabilis]EXC31958.1 Legumin A [Morus notabilis]
MAKPVLLISLSVCLLVLFHGCLARPTGQYLRQNECQLDRLEAREPDHRVQSEGGLFESWNPNHEQFQCAGVALLRLTIQPNGLHLPSYTNAPQLVHIIRGRGVVGTLFPGCPETFEESQQGTSRRSQDRHQKLHHIREGDVLALPAGVAYWSYNDGDSPLVVVSLFDVSNHDNQLDRFPRRFNLAGNPQDEFLQSRREEQYREGSHEQRRREEQHQEQGSRVNNIFRGFSIEFIQEAFKVDSETARRIQSQNDKRGSIIKLKERLDLVRPGRSREEQEHEMRQEEQRQTEREHARRQGGGGRYMNGVEETFCTMRLRENIGDPSRADVYSPQAGRLSSVNSYNLPILNWLQLSAERGFLYSNALYSPHWNINAHSVIYVIRGSARCQVVDDFGRSVFDGELRQGQALTVPQNFAIVKQAENEGFEWVSFKTNDRAKVNQLAGRTSYIQALPEDVIANAYQISREQARRLKYNRQEVSMFRTSERSPAIAA